ncbi:MAG: HD domain-containing protein [Oscillospiraceae bacterium]
MASLPDLVDYAQVPAVVQRTLNHVDARLMDHGARVASIVGALMDAHGGFTPQQKWDGCFLALVHDIGAYKTEEIDLLVHFETGNVWAHSIYGYLFLKYFSPLPRLSEAILYHHTPWQYLSELTDVDDDVKLLAQLINLGDRTDLYFGAKKHSAAEFRRYLKRTANIIYSPEVLALFLKAAPSLPPKPMPTLLPDEVILSNEAATDYLRMLVFAIDFRSAFTVTHTVTTAAISQELGKLMNLPKQELSELAFGALLHDLGKIGVPVEVLENHGRLVGEDMMLMRTHVVLTGDILGDAVSPAVRDIAVRHHEKLDGTGYPLGLTGDDLNLPQRIIAVADIVSALTSRRSYKTAYPKSRTVAILTDMDKRGFVDHDVVAMMLRRFDSVMATVDARCAPILQSYAAMHKEYDELSLKFH